MMIDLNKVQMVIRSDWNGDYYLEPPVDSVISICDDYEPDAELYKAITALIEGWPCEVNPKHSYEIYHRPREQ